MGAADAQHPVAHPVLARVDQERAEQHHVEPLVPQVQRLDGTAHRTCPDDLRQHLRRLVHRRHAEPALHQRVGHPARPAAQFENARPLGGRTAITSGSSPTASRRYSSTAHPSGVMAPGPVPAYPSRTSDSPMEEERAATGRGSPPPSPFRPPPLPFRPPLFVPPLLPFRPPLFVPPPGGSMLESEVIAMRTGSEPVTARSPLRMRLWLSLWGTAWALFGLVAFSMNRAAGLGGGLRGGAAARGGGPLRDHVPDAPGPALPTGP